MSTESILLQRQSKRAYRPEAVPDDVLQRVMEKARWAPSCSNNQPWKFVVVREPAALAKVQDALTAGNAWAAKAPILIAVVSCAADDRTRVDNGIQYYLFDCGLAVENLLLAAVEEGLMGHPMAGFSAPKVTEGLHIPEEYQVICMISLGYPGDTADLDTPTRAKDARSRARKPLTEIVFHDGWQDQK